MNDVLMTPIRLNEFENLIQNSVRKVLQENAQLVHFQPEPDSLLNIKQAAELLNLSVPTIYSYVQKAEIPVCKISKRLYFSKFELTNWIKASRKKTSKEIESQAESYINKKGLTNGK